MKMITCCRVYKTSDIEFIDYHRDQIKKKKKLKKNPNSICQFSQSSKYIHFNTHTHTLTNNYLIKQDKENHFGIKKTSISGFCVATTEQQQKKSKTKQKTTMKHCYYYSV